MVFHWSLSDSKSPQISRTLLSFLAVLNNAVVWMISTRPPTAKSSSPFSNPLVTVPNTPITIGIIVTCIFFFLLLLLLLLFNFQYYFQFLTALRRIFTQDLAWGKVGIICILYIYIVCCVFWGDIFLSHWKYSPKKMKSSTTCNILYFIKAETARDLGKMCLSVPYWNQISVKANKWQLLNRNNYLKSYNY